MELPQLTASISEEDLMIQRQIVVPGQIHSETAKSMRKKRAMQLKELGNLPILKVSIVDLN